MYGAYLSATPEVLTERLGIQFEVEGTDGLGPMDVALLEDEYGKQFLLTRLKCVQNPQHTAVRIREDTKDITGDVCDALEALEINSSEVIHFHLDFRKEQHSLWRQDDHGHRYLVGTFPCRSDVAIVLRRLTMYQHKQMYWIEKGDGTAES